MYIFTVLSIIYVNYGENMIDHVAFVVPDIKEAIDWYESKIDVKIIQQDKSWAMLEIFGTKLALVLPGHHPPHFAIKSELSKFPCRPDEIKTHRDNSSYYYLCDPYGNAIEWINYNK